jgi:hypothetical protein
MMCTAQILYNDNSMCRVYHAGKLLTKQIMGNAGQLWTKQNNYGQSRIIMDKAE